jgi:drug/metabolite transporter (DMT)-like permease
VNTDQIEQHKGLRGILSRFTLRGRGFLLPKAHLLRVGLLSLLGITSNMVSVAIAMKYTKASSGTLLYSTVPALTIFVAMIAKTERPTRWKVAG